MALVPTSTGVSSPLGRGRPLGSEDGTVLASWPWSHRHLPLLLPFPSPCSKPPHRHTVTGQGGTRRGPGFAGAMWGEQLFPLSTGRKGIRFTRAGRESQLFSGTQWVVDTGASECPAGHRSAHHTALSCPKCQVVVLRKPGLGKKVTIPPNAPPFLAPLRICHFHPDRRCRCLRRERSLVPQVPRKDHGLIPGLAREPKQ